MDPPRDSVVVITLVPDAEGAIPGCCRFLGDVDRPFELVDLDLRADCCITLPLSQAVFEPLVECWLAGSTTTASDGHGSSDRSRLDEFSPKHGSLCHDGG